MLFIKRTIKYYLISKKVKDTYLKKLFIDFHNISLVNFGSDFVDFIDSKSTKELIFLLLKCKEHEASNISTHEACKLIFLETFPELKNNLSKEQIDEINNLIFKSHDDGLKEPARFSLMLNAEINRRNQNSLLLTTFLLIFVTIAISIITSLISLKQNSVNSDIKKLNYEIIHLRNEVRKNIK